MSTPEEEIVPAEEIPLPDPPIEAPEELPEEPAPIEKPDGFDTRERLSSDWKPKDVVYQASQDIADSADALFVCWMEGEEIRFHSSGDARRVPGLIVAALGAYMGWK